uniref:FIIND domain-containing protein n=1 Tax=Podarcis muralis TaxID=64176 RepID=A0A670JJB3_PODMU
MQNKVALFVFVGLTSSSAPWCGHMGVRNRQERPAFRWKRRLVPILMINYFVTGSSRDNQTRGVFGLRNKLCFTKAGSFLCFYTDVIFEVRGAVTITYHFDSWSKHLAEQNTEDWVVAGPLINIEADPAEAVAAVHFPHFLCLAGKSDSQVHIAHFVEGGMSLEKPDRVGPYHVVLENPNFSPRGAILRTSWSWFKRKIKVHTVALLYQMLRFSSPKFHLYLLPNDSSLRKVIGILQL